MFGEENSEICHLKFSVMVILCGGVNTELESFPDPAMKPLIGSKALKHWLYEEAFSKSLPKLGGMQWRSHSGDLIRSRDFQANLQEIIVAQAHFHMPTVNLVRRSRLLEHSECFEFLFRRRSDHLSRSYGFAKWLGGLNHREWRSQLASCSFCESLRERYKV
ncbi:hypothetical protein BGZ60DRAFT_75961 [Tricladium varicosporioides]|nr:hypothetical protein BGZ60DRAFT_75961 [Hymenoscyphus varicosporioides]